MQWLAERGQHTNTTSKDTAIRREVEKSLCYTSVTRRVTIFQISSG